MKSYEIERKYLIHTIPFDLKEYAFHDIEQGYLCTESYWTFDKLEGE